MLDNFETHFFKIKNIYKKYVLYYLNMDDEITVIKNVKVRYLTTKMDKYDNELIWFRIDKTSIAKLNVLNKVDFKLPYFETDDGKTLLKVKSKNVKLNDLTNDVVIACDIAFKYYKMGDFEGYFVNRLS